MRRLAQPFICIGLIGTLCLPRNQCSALQTTTTRAGFAPAAFFQVRQHLPKEKAAAIVDQKLFPIDDTISRFEASAIFDASNTQTDSEETLFDGASSRECTYGEFPLESLDILLDKALEYVPKQKRDEVKMVDVGSGCGRLSIYTSLRREGWKVGGVEISPALHKMAYKAAETVAEEGLIAPADDEHDTTDAPTIFVDGDDAALVLLCGPVDRNPELVRESDLLFCYSTAMESGEFNETIDSAILSEEWNKVLTQNCKKGCVVITTDCALDPSYGWTLLDEIDVKNPDVLESTGFIQRLDG